MLAFIGLEHDQEWIEGDFFLFFAQPRFKLLRQESRNDFVIAVSGAELKIERNVQIPRSSARRARFWSSFGEVVEAVEQLLMSGVLLMTFNAIKELRSHV